MTNHINLADRAVLVQLSRKRMRTSYRDDEVEGQIRFAYNDESLTAFAHIFQQKTNPGNPVRKLLREYDSVYALSKKSTAESYVRGSRLLPSHKVFEYTEMMNTAMDGVSRQVPGLVARWDDLVAQDMRLRGSRARIGDYPDKSQVPGMFAFELRILPLPSNAAMPLNLSPEMAALLNDSVEGTLRDTEERVRADLLSRMLDPIRHAVQRLQVPVGAKGQRFHAESMVTNLREAVQQARDLNISFDPEITQLTNELEGILDKHMDPEALKHTQTGRDTAKTELDALLNKLGI
jgi:hypothetical protein